MRYSQLLIPTVKEVPAEAEIPSHQLMIRAGFIRKLASGTYTYLPLGWRSLRKIMQIVREEMDAAGAQEISMPILQPMELWQKTGRDVVFKEIICSFEDRHGRTNILAPTAEEVVTALIAGEVNSYKQLPINLYQINYKFRDEFRPRFGVLRSREFIMKDAYSFDATVEGLDASYRKMYDAYCRIFDRCGLKCVTVEAESGGMGGTDTEEFMVLCSAGEDVIVHTADYSYAANIDKAEVDPLVRDGWHGHSASCADDHAYRSSNADVRKHGHSQTPGDDHATPPMEEVHTPNLGTIQAVCAFLKTQPTEMIKTLICSTGEKTVAALIRGDHESNEGKLARAAQAEVIELADADTILRVTGAAVGFAGPQGLAGKVDKLIIDHAVAAMAAGVAGANKTDYHVRNVVPGRDFPLAGDNVVVADIRNAAPGDTHKGRPLEFSRGIEVGHVFKLGTKYSQKLEAWVLDASGKTVPCIMGCYGIGINRILAAAIEIGNDKDGCILPVNIAPFEVEIVQVNNDNAEVVAAAERLYDELAAAGVDVLLDDRDARPGVKFKDADLIGFPLRVVVGERGLKAGAVEVKRRTDAKAAAVPLAEAVTEVRRILEEMKAGASH